MPFEALLLCPFAVYLPKAQAVPDSCRSVDLVAVISSSMSTAPPKAARPMGISTMMHTMIARTEIIAPSTRNFRKMCCSVDIGRVGVKIKSSEKVFLL